MQQNRDDTLLILHLQGRQINLEYIFQIKDTIYKEMSKHK